MDVGLYKIVEEILSKSEVKYSDISIVGVSNSLEQYLRMSEQPKSSILIIQPIMDKWSYRIIPDLDSEKVNSEILSIIEDPSSHHYKIHQKHLV